MKKIILICCLAIVAAVQFASAQDRKFDYRLKAGFNLGGTIPIPFPAEIRKIKGYSPTLAFALGGDVIRNINDKWGVFTGLRFETKGMSTDARVKSYKMTISISDGEETGSASGYFTGDVKTKVRNEYMTIPIAVRYKISKAFEVNAGIFLSAKLRSDFSGEAFDGFLRDQTPTGQKIGVTTATYNLSKDIRPFNWGFQAGMHWKAYRDFSLYADFTMGLNSVFPSDFETISFKMYNMYLNVGFAYNF